MRGLESMEFLLTAEERRAPRRTRAEGRYSIVDWLFQPELSPPPHVHHSHSEVFYFVSGRMEWTMNGETQVMEAGDLLYIDGRRTRITWGEVAAQGLPVGGEEVRAILIYEPGGFERGAIESVALTDGQRNDPAFMSDFFTRQLYFTTSISRVTGAPDRVRDTSSTRTRRRRSTLAVP